MMCTDKMGSLDTKLSPTLMNNNKTISTSPVTNSTAAPLQSQSTVYVSVVLVMMMILSLFFYIKLSFLYDKIEEQQAVLVSLLSEKSNDQTCSI